MSSGNDDGWGRVRPRLEDLRFDDDDDDRLRDQGNGHRAPVGNDEGSDEGEETNAAMQVEATTTANPLRDDILPGMEGVPSSELYQTFNTDGYKGDLNEYYTFWDNGIQHDKKFTCIFTSPLTGEHFACGRLENVKGGIAVIGSTYWCE